MCIDVPPREAAAFIAWDDDALAAAARGGSHDAFCELIARHHPALVRLAYRLTRDPHEADDVVQETLFRAYRGLTTFAPDRSFAAWLFTIARNTAYDALRRSRRVTTLDDCAEALQPGPEEAALRNDDALRLRAALAELPERYRAVLDLYYLKGLLYREISGELGIPLGTVKTFLKRAKRRMREELAA